MAERERALASAHREIGELRGALTAVRDEERRRAADQALLHHGQLRAALNGWRKSDEALGAVEVSGAGREGGKRVEGG